MIDKDALRTKYREERDKRIRPDGNDQYLEPTGRFASLVEDPNTERVEREPVHDHVTVERGPGPDHVAGSGPPAAQRFVHHRPDDHETEADHHHDDRHDHDHDHPVSERSALVIRSCVGRQLAVWLRGNRPSRRACSTLRQWSST